MFLYNKEYKIRHPYWQNHVSRENKVEKDYLHEIYMKWAAGPGSKVIVGVRSHPKMEKSRSFWV